MFFEGTSWIPWPHLSFSLLLKGKGERWQLFELKLKLGHHKVHHFLKREKKNEKMRPTEGKNRGTINSLSSFISSLINGNERQ